MKEILEEFKIEVLTTNTSFIVKYNKDQYNGYCKYKLIEKKGINKPIKQRFFILEETEMGDVIEYLHQRVGLKKDMLEEINKLIKDHPLDKLEKYKLISDVVTYM